MIAALIGKELHEDAGAARLAWARALLAAGVAVACIATAPPDLAGLSDIPRFGRLLFRGTGWFLVAAALLLPVTLAAGSVAGERRAGTLAVLHAAGFSSLGIVLAKILARAGSAILTGLVVVPPLLLLQLYGGATGAEVVALAGTCFATAIWGAALGVLASTVFDDPRSALFVGVGGALAYTVFVPVGAAVVRVAGGGVGGGVGGGGGWPWVAPLGSAYNLLELGLVEAGDLSLAAPWAGAAGLLLGQALLWLVAAALLLPRFATRGLRLTELAAAALAPLRRGIEALAPDPTDLLAPGAIDNPFAWREVRGVSGISRGTALAGTLVVEGLLLVLYVALGLTRHGPSTHAVMIGGLAFGGALLSAILAAGSITADKESRSLELLTHLEVTPYRYLDGKFQGLCSVGLIFAAPAVLHAVIWWLAGSLPGAAVLVCVAGIPPVIACGVAHGLWCSLGARSTPRAVAAVIAAQVVFPVLQVALAVSATGAARDVAAGWDEAWVLLLLPNPLPLTVGAVGWLADGGAAGVSGPGVFVPGLIAIALLWGANVAYTRWVLNALGTRFPHAVEKYLEKR